jgi:hypothetical protein
MEIFTDVYVEEPPELERQRSEFAAYLSSFEGGAH